MPGHFIWREAVDASRRSAATAIELPRHAVYGGVVGTSA